MLYKRNFHCITINRNIVSFFQNRKNDDYRSFGRQQTKRDIKKGSEKALCVLDGTINLYFIQSFPVPNFAVFFCCFFSPFLLQHNNVCSLHFNLVDCLFAALVYNRVAHITTTHMSFCRFVFFFSVMFYCFSAASRCMTFALLVSSGTK